MLKHEAFMREAIELSRNGFPAPNPHVGCVIVKDDQIVGRGFCDHDGADHAEVVALAEAGERAKGATAYVTLEPCNHFGQTPPCSQALAKSGIARVFVATRDRNPIAKGGVEYLKEIGIEVEVGLCAFETAEANTQFLFAMAEKRPMVTVKAGMTMDGRIALANGESKWITNDASRLDAMRLRAEVGCVMIGRATAEQDKARLNVRGVHVANQPLRVVIDPRSVLDHTLPIFDDTAPTLHLTNQSGIDSPQDILHRIWERERTGVLIEGGPTTTAHFLKAGLVDQVVLYVAPRIFGEGKSWIGTFGLPDLNAAPLFELVHSQVIESDVKLTYHSRNLAKFLASYKL